MQYMSIFLRPPFSQPLTLSPLSCKTIQSYLNETKVFVFRDQTLTKLIYVHIYVHIALEKSDSKINQTQSRQKHNVCM